MGTLVVNNLQRMVKLINTFKEIDTTKNAEYNSYFSVNDYLQDTIWMLNKKLKTNNIELTCNIDEKINIYGDHTQFTQLLSSLLINSIIHGFAHKDSGHINITFKKEGDNLLMTYRDNGQGMSNEQIKKLYDPFYSSQLGKGTSGLGMYIVYNIINQGFQGSIKCESELAKGVVFEIVLPMIRTLAEVSINGTL
jgi:signal transduction histidine kinase